MNKQELYRNIEKRWQDAEANLDGILGGFSELNEADLSSSRHLLQKMIELGVVKVSSALDCCCGIGRVSENLLLDYFENIDLFDQEPKFIDLCRDKFVDNVKIGDISCCSLQDYEFTKKYDVIWSQWSFENLENDDFVLFLQKCKSGLSDDGVIIAKENVCDSSQPYFLADSSKIRSVEVLREFYGHCGFDIIFEQKVENWPQDMFEIVSFVLKPQEELFL